MSDPVFYPTHAYHCPTCFQEGWRTPRYRVVYQNTGSPHVWDNTFPCYGSASEFARAMQPFCDKPIEVEKL